MNPYYHTSSVILDIFKFIKRSNYKKYSATEFQPKQLDALLNSGHFLFK